MSKYFTVFQIAWQNEFVYRLNFLLWRFRNILRLLMTFFLWRGIFVSNNKVFGYNQPEIFAYIFLVLVIQTIIFSAPSADNIGGEISSGDLSNYLVKPISYLKYWFTRDLASKLLNIIFAFMEILLLWFVLRPNIYLPADIFSILGFVISIFMATLIYYFVNVITKFVAFWTPENTWGLTFVTLVLIEILAGQIFPLDVLPHWAITILDFTPFPYLVYYPIAILLGKTSGINALRVLLQSLIWLVLMSQATKYIWKKGLIAYSSEGR